MQREDIQRDEQQLDESDYPNQIQINSISLPLHYHFDPSHHADGISVEIPVAVLGGLSPDSFEWLVPSMLREKIVALIKNLPKALRKNFVPATNFADAVMARMSQNSGDLLQTLADNLQQITGVKVEREFWQPELLPDHLRFNFSIVDDAGQSVAQGKELQQLQQQFSGQIRESIQSLTQSRSNNISREGIRSWDFAELPVEFELQQGGLSFTTYPALVDHTESVSIQLFETRELADHNHRGGVVRLLYLTKLKRFKALAKDLQLINAIALQYATMGSGDEIRREIIDKIIEWSITKVSAERPLPRTAAEFEQLSEAIGPHLYELGSALTLAINSALTTQRKLQQDLKKAFPPELLQNIADIREQLQRLIYPHFVVQMAPQWLARIDLYLEALRARLEKGLQSPANDRELMLSLQRLESPLEKLSDEKQRHPAIIEFKGLLQELRISLFAQQLGTVASVSNKRLEKRWAEISKLLRQGN
jgi:ATP-dependent helicase HrpA